MKRVFIRLIVLVALFVNIAHDSIIAVGDKSANEPVFEYVFEQTHKSDCGHMGQNHSLFHFTAIITPAVPYLTAGIQIKPPVYKTPVPVVLLTETPIKPPIA